MIQAKPPAGQYTCTHHTLKTLTLHLRSQIVRDRATKEAELELRASTAKQVIPGGCACWTFSFCGGSSSYILDFYWTRARPFHNSKALDQ